MGILVFNTQFHKTSFNLKSFKYCKLKYMTLLKIMFVLRGKKNLKVINLVYALHLKHNEVSFSKTTALAEPEYSAP